MIDGLTFFLSFMQQSAYSHRGKPALCHV